MALFVIPSVVINSWLLIKSPQSKNSECANCLYDVTERELLGFVQGGGAVTTPGLLKSRVAPRAVSGDGGTGWWSVRRGLQVFSSVAQQG